MLHGPLLSLGLKYVRDHISISSSCLRPTSSCALILPVLCFFFWGIRCEHSALQETKDGNKEYVMVRAFNEWNPNASSGNDWRGKLGMQRLSIIAAYLKNNSNVVTRWTYSSMLAGNTTMKLGFVSRATPDENQRHSILGVHSVKTQQMAQELKANLHNGFGKQRERERGQARRERKEGKKPVSPSLPSLRKS